ncbi:expressed unknown protein [Seminavis robusta]|uniref:Uncharacterized protein n=1 Tax=Seminavis robusta TaxID=568900 RepID=A0A9N8H9E2_9STRA|nr:expressed unknown protein [Seminavis robusta]|eukprot:Sro115_g056660.1 n/a (145) ;mRNA; f:32876-33310
MTLMEQTSTVEPVYGECECVKEVVEEKCISPIDNEGKYCRALMTSTMDPVGSVCIEVLENPMQLEITVTAKDDYSLVKSSLWVGEDASLIPEDDTGIPDYPNFPYTWTNTNEETLEITCPGQQIKYMQCGHDRLWFDCGFASHS